MTAASAALDDSPVVSDGSQESQLGVGAYDHVNLLKPDRWRPGVYGEGVSLAKDLFTAARDGSTIDSIVRMVFGRT